MSRPKKPSLASAMKNAASTSARPPAATSASPPPVPVKAVVKSHPISPKREGLKPVQGYFSPEVRKQLKRLAAEEESSIQELLREALEDLFRKRNLTITVE